MQIEKVINNNVVSSRDDKNREIIIMGKGIGFKAKEGYEIPAENIEKIFRIESQNTFDQFKALLENLPLEHIQVSNQIISHTKSVLNKKLNQSIYLTLTDHINFAVERFNQGLMFHNALLGEIKTFYHQEYLIGEYAIELIHKELGIKFPIDEAASIALHIVNAEYNTMMSDTMKTAKMIPEIIKIMTDCFDITIDETSLYYERFILHLKFLIQRVFNKQILDSRDEVFDEMIIKLYPEEFQCSQKISEYIYQIYDHSITGEELAYLTVHIKRIRSARH